MQKIAVKYILQIQDESTLEAVLNFLKIEVLSDQDSIKVENSLKEIENSKKNGKSKPLALAETLAFLKS